MSINKLVIGTWQMGEDPKKKTDEMDALKYALKHGITHIDTAEMDGDGKAEILVGEVIQDFDRSKLHITTKIYPHHANHKDFKKSFLQSLKRLNTTYIDLYLLHWLDESVDLREVINLFEHFKSLGLIKSWGVSNFDVADMQHLLSLPKGTNCFTNQILYHLGARGIEFDLIPWVQSHNCLPMFYSTLGHSVSYRQAITDNLSIQSIAKKHNASVYQIMLAFTLEIKPAWSVAKASSVAHMKELIDALKIKLDPENMALINQNFKLPLHKVPLEMI